MFTYVLKDFSKVLDAAGDIIGKPGGSVILDAQVIEHGWQENGEDPKDDLITIGVKGTPITLADVSRAFLEASKISSGEGRSYFFEGIRGYIKKDEGEDPAEGDPYMGKKVYIILWGS